MNMAERLQTIFEESGWKTLDSTKSMKEAGLDGLFLSGYAAVGVSLLHGVEQVLENWPKCQSVMAELRDDPRVGKLKDLYLLFVMSKIHPSCVEALQVVCNDTHVCRKICIELGDRDIKDVIMETPFLKFELPDQFLPSGSFPIGQVSELILQDLARSSKERILDHLLSGKYDHKEQTDET